MYTLSSRNNKAKHITSIMKMGAFNVQQVISNGKYLITAGYFRRFDLNQSFFFLLPWNVVAYEYNNWKFIFFVETEIICTFSMQLEFVSLNPIYSSEIRFLALFLEESGVQLKILKQENPRKFVFFMEFYWRDAFLKKKPNNKTFKYLFRWIFSCFDFHLSFIFIWILCEYMSVYSSNKHF